MKRRDADKAGKCLGFLEQMQDKRTLPALNLKMPWRRVAIRMSYFKRAMLSDHGVPSRNGRCLGLVSLLVIVMAIAAARSAQGAVIFVTDLTDKISASGGCSLKEAIYSANFDNNVAIDFVNEDGTDHFITTQCVPGNGDDRIILPTAAVLQMSEIVDDPYNYMGPTATPIIFSNITIEGHGARLEHVPNGVNFRAFAVGNVSVNSGGNITSSTGSLTIKNVHLKGFTVKGGDGGSGGGGGMGAGGAVYVNQGTLMVEGSTFEANGAVGGNGGLREHFLGTGGGGGIGGDGGAIQDKASSGGGGGGGARGKGGAAVLSGGGGGGGGTLSDGQSGLNGGAPGIHCGGAGARGNNGDNGDNGSCWGGGGGGGEADAGNGGAGSYGGGGGGAGMGLSTGGSGGPGGFGGGGGSSGSVDRKGGSGGYGGGGGDLEGPGGFFGGRAGLLVGGGGAGLGGAVFNDRGAVTVRNSTFTANYVARGAGGGGFSELQGADAGAAIFSFHGSLTVENSTLADNESTGALGGIIFDNRSEPCSGACLGYLPTSFTLRNTIVANNGGAYSAAQECSILNADPDDTLKATLTVDGSGNLIKRNDTDAAACPGVVATDDPQLGALQLNQGPTPTMAIPQTSPAWNAADSGTSLPTDQRGQERPAMSGFDIGAFELCERLDGPCLILSGTQQKTTLNVQTSLATGGTTAPAPGTYSEDLDSIVVVTATANPNYCFVNWTGNVTNATSPTSTVIMADEQTVQANFASLTTTLVKPIISPSANHNMVNVGLAATGGCGANTIFQVRVFGDEDDQTATDAKGTVFSPDASNIALDTLQLRAERLDSGDGRVYLIVVNAVEDNSRHGFSCSTVAVPHDASAGSLAQVNSQAAAAKAYCEANSGQEPPSYFVIGDGPVIGKK